METVLYINLIVAALFLACYAYQFYYLLVPWIKKPKPHLPPVPHRLAVLICARNEEEVIADLCPS